jgi:hypothetical protein
VLSLDALGDEQGFAVGFFQPTESYLRYELRVVATTNVLGRAAYSEKATQHTCVFMSGKSMPHFDRQAFSRSLGAHHKQPTIATALDPNHSKALRTSTMLFASTVTHATVFTSARKSSLATFFSWNLHGFSLPNSMGRFPVHPPASLPPRPSNAFPSKT